MMLSIDQWAWSNGLRDVHPVDKGLLSAAGLMVCLLSHTPWIPAAVTAGMMIVLVAKAKIPFATFARLLAVPSAFLLTGCLTMALSFSPPDSIWQLSFGSHVLGISPSGLEQARDTLLRSLGATACLYFFVLTTPMVDAIGLVHRLPLPKIIGDLMLLVYRFIFVLLEATQSILVAQQARLGYANPRNSLRSMGILAANLFIRSLIRSRELYTALSARGYEDHLRVLPREFPAARRNRWLVGLTGAVVLGFTLFSSGGGSY